MKISSVGRIAAIHFLTLFFLTLFAAEFARADSLTLASVGTAIDAGQSNSNGDTIAIAPNSLWLAALPGSSWVSFGTTGSVSAPGFFVVPNGTDVSFFDVFNVAGTPTGGSLSVLADDSATVYLNGTLLATEAARAGNTYATCSDFGVGCLVSTVINLPASVLQSGSNTLEFDVAQRNGVSFGLDYVGSVIVPATLSVSVAEPGIAVLMVLGLVSIGGASFLRKPGQPISVSERPLEYPAIQKFSEISSSSESDEPASAELDEFEIRRRAFFS
jgi:hypothetical protein